MKSAHVFFLGCLAGPAVHAEDVGHEPARPAALVSDGAYLMRAVASAPLLSEFASKTKAGRKPALHETSIAAAISSAAKKDFIDAGIEASTNMLLECQKETSVVLVTPSLRSNSQRDHCFRF